MAAIELSILAIDDNRDNLTTLKAVVRDAFPGARVLTAMDGRDGIELALSEDPDVILLDVIMPGMDGFEVCRRLKHDERVRHIPVVFLTALKTDRSSRIRALETGAEAFLAKPIDEAELTAQIRAMAKIKRGAVSQRQEKERLATLVAERTKALQQELAERHRVETALRSSEHRFRSIFDQVTDGLVLVDPETGAITHGNRAMWEMLGCSEDELLRLAIHDVYRDGVRPPAGDPRDARGESRVSAGLPIKRKDGTVLFADVTSLHVTIGGRALIMDSFRDVTETLALQGRIAQSDRLATMGMLAAGVAHEINNPLSYVMYNIESLDEDLPKLASAVKRCCASLREQVGITAFDEISGEGGELMSPDRLNDIVERAREALSGARRIRDVARGLSSFSRVEDVEWSDVQLRDAIEPSVNMAYNEIKYRARLEKDYGDVPLIWASEGKLSQVFLNLLINAAHAVEEGDVAGNLIAIRTWSDRGSVFAEVSDTGKGIAPEHLARIFDPFFSTKGIGKGSGLGLAICSNIVREFGGEIRVESELGKGSRFIVRLPVRQASERAVAASTQSDTALPLGVRGRILLVDDEVSIRRTIARLLGQEHELVAAASGEEARVILEKDPSFDLILCDLMMPEVTGMELHEWLAARDPSLAKRVVFMTGGAFTPRAAEYVSSAGNLRIDKPFSGAALKTLVTGWIAASKG